MPDELSFEHQIAWAPDGPARTATVAPSWHQGRTAFGGLLAGAAARAVVDVVGEERPLRTVLGQFVAPTGEGPLRLTASPLREGRNMTHAEATVHRADGGVAARYLVATGAGRPSELASAPVARPELAGPEGLTEMPYLEGIAPKCTQYFAYRFAAGAFPFSGASEGAFAGWIRHRTEARGPSAVLGLIDALPSPVLPLLTRPAPASTVSWTTHLLPLPDQDPEGWWAFDSATTYVRDGYAVFRATLWAPDGTRAALVDQLVAVFA